MRPRDPVTLKPMPPPCQRFDMLPFHEAALPAINADPRSPALPAARKLQMIDRAVNHVIDGDKPPLWVMKKNWDRPEDHFMKDLWDIAVARCKAVAHA
jgi:hypothetical protein